MNIVKTDDDDGGVYDDDDDDGGGDDEKEGVDDMILDKWQSRATLWSGGT